MKKITRADLRGRPLDKDCYRANRATHEFGKNDNRIFCFGLYISCTEEIRKECIDCKAFVDYATPLKEDKNE